MTARGEALRAARADAVAAWLAPRRSALLDAYGYRLWADRGLSRGALDLAVDDLVADGRARVEPEAAGVRLRAVESSEATA